MNFFKKIRMTGLLIYVKAIDIFLLVGVVF